MSEKIESLSLRSTLKGRVCLEADSFSVGGSVVGCNVRFDGNNVPVDFSMNWKTSEERPPVQIIFQPQDRCAEAVTDFRTVHHSDLVRGEHAIFVGQSEGGELTGYVDVACTWMEYHGGWYPISVYRWEAAVDGGEETDLYDLPVYDFQARLFLPDMAPLTMVGLYEPADGRFIRPCGNWAQFLLRRPKSDLLLSAATQDVRITGDRRLNFCDPRIALHVRARQSTDSAGTALRWAVGDLTGQGFAARLSGELVIAWRLSPVRFDADTVWYD